MPSSVPVVAKVVGEAPKLRYAYGTVLVPEPPVKMVPLSRNGETAAAAVPESVTNSDVETVVALSVIPEATHVVPLVF